MEPISAGDGFMFVQGEIVVLWGYVSDGGNKKVKVMGWTQNRIVMLKEFRERSFDQGFCRGRIKIIH